MLVMGEHILKRIGWLESASEIVASHHEKWNGSGYPRQLKQDKIPIAARIFAVLQTSSMLSVQSVLTRPL